MKFILAVLLLLNLALYSAWQGWLGSSVKRGLAVSEAEPGRLLQQTSPERLQVLTPAPVAQNPLSLTPALTTPTSARIATPAAAPATAPNATSNTPASFIPPTPLVAAATPTAPVTAANATLACVELGAFNSKDAQTWSDKLRGLGFAQVNQRLAAPVNGFLVYLPNENRAARDKKIQEIRASNENDLAVLQENSPLSHAISLGVFGTQDAASARVAALNKKGITGARIIQRGEKSPRSFVQVLGLEESRRSSLEPLAKEAGLAWRSCASETTTRR